MLRTLSSATEKPIWDHCTSDDPCIMPNIKRTPDITVVIFPDDYEKIGKCLGKSLQDPNTINGMKATMQ